MIAISLALALAETFNGTITDTMCGAKHTMMKDQPDHTCVKMCVKGSSEYAPLFDGQNIFRLNDQSKPAKFAAQKVKVTGTLDQETKTIKISSIDPL
jgi:hypothetical protein